MVTMFTMLDCDGASIRLNFTMEAAVMVGMARVVAPGSSGRCVATKLGGSMMTSAPLRTRGNYKHGPRRLQLFQCAKSEVVKKKKKKTIVLSSGNDTPPTFPLLELYEFICSGPLLKKIGYTPEKVGQQIDEWLALGVKLSRQLKFDEFALSQSEKVRIYHYYVPVFLWCKRQLDIHTSKFKPGEPVPALVIGISAPQGCGKTTIVYSLEYLFNSLGSRAASISIDDFYLTAAEQRKLSANNPGNKLLEMRGNAGSHDLKLGTETLKALRCLTTSDKEIKLPRYDKSANAGLGDRADQSQWPKIEGPLKVVLFEGWMLGFEPQKESVVASVDPQLVLVNRNLAAYHDAWHKFINSWIIVQVEDPVWVFRWRLQAEVAMRAEGKAGMTDQQVADFCSRYMPAYKAYLPALYGQGPIGSGEEHMLVLHIDENHSPIG